MDYFTQLSCEGQVCLGFICALCTYIGLTKVYGIYMGLVNNKIRSRKTQENAQSIEDLAQRLKRNPISEKQVDHITSLSLERLCSELKQGKIRPIEALKAYQTKALESHRRTNCLVEVITEAEELALELENGPRDGALWGVPLSLKDDMGIKGYDSTLGLVNRVGKPSPDDADLLKVLRRNGAIPFVKTNVPQTEMSFEPGNPINGLVHNPHKHGHGPGGSSSGEAALIGSGGSILGIGSDLAGSVRIPAHYCGVYSFKPTSERIATRGTSLDEHTVTPIRPVWGPLARDMDGLVTTMKVLWEDAALAKSDPECVAMAFNSKAYTCKKKLRIGYYVENGMSPTFSACKRPVETAKRILSEMGHELVPWQPPEPKYIFGLALRVIQSDGGEDMRKDIQYDVTDPTIDHFTKGIFLPRWLKKALAFMIKPVNPELSELIDGSCGPGSIALNGKLTYELWQYRRAVQDCWNDAGLDAVICPPNVMAAPPFGNAELIHKTCMFTAIYSVLHYPAGVIPASHVKQSDIDQLIDDFPPGDSTNDQIRKAMENSLGLPVGLMIVTLRYHDEMCLNIMKILDEAMKRD